MNELLRVFACTRHTLLYGAARRVEHLAESGTIQTCLASGVWRAQTLKVGFVRQNLCGDLFSNPHSQPAGGAEDPDGPGGAAAAEARAATLALCNAPPGEYVCVFTSGATGARRGGLGACSMLDSDRRCTWSVPG